MNKYYDISNLLDMNGKPITINFENKYIKKIDEILSNINSKYEEYYVQDIVSGEDLKLLVDYINKIRNYYNDNVDKYEDLIVKYSDILEENKQLKKQKDDVAEYIKKHFQDEGVICKYVGDNACEVNENFIDDLLRMLGETDE